MTTPIEKDVLERYIHLTILKLRNELHLDQLTELHYLSLQLPHLRKDQDIVSKT
jgi:hypothetical protein